MPHRVVPSARKQPDHAGPVSSIPACENGALKELQPRFLESCSETSNKIGPACSGPIVRTRLRELALLLLRSRLLLCGRFLLCCVLHRLILPFDHNHDFAPLMRERDLCSLYSSSRLKSREKCEPQARSRSRGFLGAV